MFSKSKICICLFSLILIFCWTGKVLAAIESYLVKDKDNVVYEYNLGGLLDSYNKNGTLWKNFDEKIKQVGVLAVYDNKSHKYVDFQALLDAYNAGTPVHQYTESSSAKDADMPPTVQVVTLGSDGKLKYTEKNVDPEYNALEAINTAEKRSQVRSVLEKNAGDLSLSLKNYNKLNNYGKNQVASGVLNQKPYESAEELKKVFDSEVSRIQKVLDQALNSVNDAGSKDDFRKALLDNANVFELDKAAYDKLSSEQKDMVIEEAFTQKPFDSIASLKNFFNVYVSSIQDNVIITYTNYSRTLKEIIDIQMDRSPQTDLYGGGWKNARREDVAYYVDPTSFDGTSKPAVRITASSLRVREFPNTDSEVLTTVNKDEVYIYRASQKVDEYTWYKIEANRRSGWVRGDFTTLTTRNAPDRMFQFLVLSGSAGTTVKDLAALLKGRGILDGTEQAFMDGSKQHNVNEVFLVCLALHETGNGTSSLATGWDYPDEDNLFPDKDYVTVYNMFGIGAYDSNPTYLGAKYAYEQRWFTPEEAIVGGAKFAGESYINHPTYKQDTLYKMRWNPATPGKHQYATDIGWAVKQVPRIKSLYDQLNTYTLKYDIPKYK